MIQSSSIREQPNDLGYGQLLAAFWRQRFWFFSVVAGVLSILVPLSLSKPTIYRSHMQLLLEPNYEGKEGLSEKKFADSNVEIDYATQRQIMLSSPLLQKAVDKLTSEYPTLDVATLREELSLNRLVENEKIETKIFQISYTGKDPEKTQRVLEVIREVYLEHNLEQQEQRLVEGLKFINSQIPKAELSIAQAEEELEEMRIKYGLIAPEQEAASLSEILKSMERERENLKAEREATNARYRELQQQLGLTENSTQIVARLSQSSAYQNLLDELQALEAQIVEQEAVLTGQNPLLRDLLAQRESKKAQLKQIAAEVLETSPSELAQIEFLFELQSKDSDTKFIDDLIEAQANLVAIENRERSLEMSEDKFRQQFNLFPEIMAQYANLLQNITAQRANLQRLLDAKQFIGIEINRGGFNWQVVEPPRMGEQIAPNTTKDLMLNTLVASFLGIAVVLLKEATDTKIHSSQQIKESLTYPILGNTPRLSLTRSKRFFFKLPFLASQNASIAEIAIWQPFRESIDLIYENLNLLYAENTLKSLSITSAVTGEGKTTFTIGLALGIARHKKKVLAIDGDLRCPSLHRNFGYTKEIDGLSNYLKSQDNILNINRYIKTIDYFGEKIDFLSAGEQTLDPVKLLSSPRFEELIISLESHYDLILIDTPPALGMVDTIKIASCCRGTIVVARINKVEEQELVEVASSLAKSNVLGIVANDFKETRSTGIARKYRLDSPYQLSHSIINN